MTRTFRWILTLLLGALCAHPALAQKVKLSTSMGDIVEIGRASCRERV